MRAVFLMDRQHISFGTSKHEDFCQGRSVWKAFLPKAQRTAKEKPANDVVEK